MTVKLTKVVRLQISGGNEADGSLVERNSLKEGEKSISCLPKLNENTTASLLVFLVENVVENRIQVLGILDENWVSETQGALQLLDKGVVQETRDCKLAVLALLLQEFCDSARWVDNQRISVESSSE